MIIKKYDLISCGYIETTIGDELDLELWLNFNNSQDCDWTLHGFCSRSGIHAVGKQSGMTYYFISGHKQKKRHPLSTYCDRATNSVMSMRSGN